MAEGTESASAIGTDHPATPPPEAEVLFGDRLPLAITYARLLATTGISHGLIGPRETPRLWSRHLVNCAVMHSLIPADEEVVDIGSGAGLPGLVLAIIRPDLHLHLVEPLLRRTNWLAGAIEELGLANVDVHRGRAEEVVGTLEVGFVTARAVASLDKLVTWSFPLLRPGGQLLALKGEAAQQELDNSRDFLGRMGVDSNEVLVLGDDVIEEPSRVVRITRPEGWTHQGTPRRPRSSQRPAAPRSRRSGHSGHRRKKR